jgi:hypothetical protein
MKRVIGNTRACMLLKVLVVLTLGPAFTLEQMTRRIHIHGVVTISSSLGECLHTDGLLLRAGRLYLLRFHYLTNAGAKPPASRFPPKAFHSLSEAFCFRRNLKSIARAGWTYAWIRVPPAAGNSQRTGNARRGTKQSPSGRP